MEKDKAESLFDIMTNWVKNGADKDECVKTIMEWW